MTRLDVWRDGRLVGSLDDSSGRLVLTWARNLLDHVPPGRPVLSVRLDAQPPDVLPQPALVRAYLGGLLPETATSARARLARRAGTSSDDVLGLLASAGGDVAGAATFVPAGAQPPRGRLDLLPDDAAVREHLQRSMTDEHLGLGDSSLPGVQPKTALTLLAGRWYVPRAGAPSTHLLKPQLPERPELVHDEALSSRAAEAAGLRAAVSHVQEFDGFAALVVPRFDRHVPAGASAATALGRGDLAVRRSHQEDAAQALGLTSDDIEAKFGWHRPAANLRAIATLLADNGGDRRDLLRLTTLNVLLGNTDAHAKNISFTHSPDGRVALAPAYDVSPHAQLGRTRLAMSVNGTFELPAVRRADVIAEARGWRVPTRAATAVVDEVTDRLRGWLTELDDAHPASEPALADVRARLTSGW